MTDVTPTTPGGPPAGWYDDTTTPGRQRWYDGTTWTDHYQTPAAPAAPAAPAVPVQHVTGPATAASLNVHRDVIYTRPQQGHSLILNLLLIGPLTLWITTIYWSVSPNHYWHA